MGESSPNSNFYFFENFVFFFCFLCVVFMFRDVKKKMDSGVGVCGLINPSFSRIFLFF